METTVRKSNLGAMFIALPMLFFGALMFLFGYFDLREWRYEGTALIVCALVWSVTGPAVFGSAVWVLVSIGRSWLPLSIGGSAIALSGAVLAIAATTRFLPCNGPA